VEKLFTSIPPEFRKYAARIFFPIIVALGLVQIELIIIALAYHASFVELILIFIGTNIYRGWYVHSWVQLEKWLLVHDREFLAHFRFLRMNIGHKLYKLLKWIGKLTNRRKPTAVFWVVLLGCGFLTGLTGIGLKFGIAMIVVSRKPKPLKLAVFLGLVANTYIFLHWGPLWLHELWVWCTEIFRGLFT